jgi:FkbM family methyltransferase
VKSILYWNNNEEMSSSLNSSISFIIFLVVCSCIIILLTIQSNHNALFKFNFLLQEQDVSMPQNPSSLHLRSQDSHMTSNLSNDVTMVNCTSMDDIQPINIFRMEHDQTKQQYKVSLSWWDVRISNNRNKTDVVVRSNPSIRKLQDLLLQYPGAFVDVGANVGFITNYGTVLNRTVYAIDPISYNIAKICEGYRENMRVGWASPGSLRLYHAAAGPLFEPLINITRPSDDIGFFDQSSLSRDAVFQQKVVTETIPMFAVDDLVSEKIGVLKIDVQGHEFGVLKGMHKILSGIHHPTAIFFEENEKLAVAAGNSPGRCTDLLSNHFGYNCTDVKGNILCLKET